MFVFSEQEFWIGGCDPVDSFLNLVFIHRHDSAEFGNDEVDGHWCAKAVDHDPESSGKWPSFGFEP